MKYSAIVATLFASALLIATHDSRAQTQEAQPSHRPTTSPCLRDGASVRAPIELAFGVPGAAGLADFGGTPSPCSHAGFSLGARGGALIATRAFYGAIDVQGNASGSYAWSDRTWATLSLDFVRYRTVINASVITAPIDLGATTLTVNQVIARDSVTQVTVFARVLLPTESGMRYGRRMGLEPGLSMVWAPSTNFALLGGLSLPYSITVSAGDPVMSFTPRATFDAALRVVKPFEILVGIEARAGLEALEYLAPRGSLRLHFARVASIDLSVMAPLGGREVTLARGSLTYAMRW
ncbi:MAG: hypothetical protein Q8Q09_10755 [Deltaproteobacteria bacterium]|nr:hypothetical protein [Deltaproteobacteria bacterium]